jgi:hypothetical protein
MERIHGQARYRLRSDRSTVTHRVGFRRAPSRTAGPGRRRAARWWSRPPRTWTVPTTAGRTTPSSAQEARGEGCWKFRLCDTGGGRCGARALAWPSTSMLPLALAGAVAFFARMASNVSTCFCTRFSCTTQHRLGVALD